MTRNDKHLARPSRWAKKLKSTAAPLKLAGRTGTVRGAFWKAVSPHHEVGEEQLAAHLLRFAAADREPECVYCGEPATDWDHLMPSREKRAGTGKEKDFTGFGSLLSNLVPACGTCNQSKGSSRWREWLEGKSPRASRARKRPGHAGRVRRLEKLQAWAERDRRPPAVMTSTPEWIRYNKLLKDIGTKLRAADKLAALLREIGVRSKH